MPRHQCSGANLFHSTNRIWEASNEMVELMAKEPILNTVRQNAESDAAQIIDAIFEILDKFIRKVKIEDDITSVVIKYFPSKRNLIRNVRGQGFFFDVTF